MEGCWGRKGCASPRAFPGPDWGRAMFVKMLSPPPRGDDPHLRHSLSRWGGWSVASQGLGSTGGRLSKTGGPVSKISAGAVGPTGRSPFPPGGSGPLWKDVVPGAQDPQVGEVYLTGHQQ